MSLRRREYLNEAGGSLGIEVPAWSTAKGDTTRARFQDFKAKKRGHKYGVEKAVFHTMTWVKPKGKDEQWSLLRLTYLDGTEQDIFINFYDASDSPFAPKGRPLYLVAFDRNDTQRNLLSTYVKTVREAKKTAREFLSKYAEKHYAVKVKRVPTSAKLPAKKRLWKGEDDMSLRRRGYLGEGGTLFGTSGSLEGIKQVISAFYVGEKITLEPIGKNEWSVANSSRVIDKVHVVKKGKRFRFEMR